MTLSQHPAWSDPGLPDWSGAAAAMCPGAKVVKILRHLPGRRATAQIITPSGPAILKAFANPRARGNDRRLRVLATTNAAAIVPTPLAVDATGHIGLIEFLPGQPLTDLAPAQLPAAAEAAGRALAALHHCGAILDRAWEIDQETTQLQRTAGPRTAHAINDLLRADPAPTPEPLLPAHRDCHPAQAIVGPDGQVRWADLDDAAMAPASLDLGNFLGHITRQELLGIWPPQLAATVRNSFLNGYGPPPPAVPAWERLTLARLLALADTRHDNQTEMQQLARHIGRSDTDPGPRRSRRSGPPAGSDVHQCRAPHDTPRDPSDRTGQLAPEGL